LNVLYPLVLFLYAVLELPKYLWRRVIHGRYRGLFRQRLGFLPREVADSGAHSPIWIHAVSVGEAQVARSLVAQLNERHPNRRIVISTITDTGQEIARNIPGVNATFYLPLDFSWCVQRAIRLVNPSLVVLIENEIWPTLTRELRKQGIPIVMVNGRVSDGSFPKYRMVARWLKPIFDRVGAFLVQTSRDAERFAEIGAPKERIEVLGSLKFDANQVGERPDLREKWRGILGISDDTILIVAGSTYPGEEEILTRVLAEVSRKKVVRMILAPRRPERFDEVAALMDDAGMTYVRRSEIERSSGKEPVILLDKMGELSSVYAAADIAFVGKSLRGFGGQNPLEPACLGIPVVFGPHTENFREMAEILLACGNSIQVNNEAELPTVLKRWIDDPEFRQTCGQSAIAVLGQHTGAAGRTVIRLEELGFL